MTCREKLAIEHPYRLNQHAIGGADQCPQSYGYMPIPDFCPFRNGGEANHEDCTRCWDRKLSEESGLIVGDEKVEHPDTDTPHILDSGNRREFGTGAVRDIQEGKGRCDLLPLDIVARYLEDEILDDIASFQKTGRVDHLYNALWKFAPHWGAIDERATSNSTMLLEVSKHYEEGCIKYGERNWQKGIPVRCYIDSGVRHYLKFIRGDKDEPHDRAFCWNILGAIWTCIHKPELCEYPVKMEVEG